MSGTGEDGTPGLSRAGRLGLPGEFADACSFLCSAQAGFISGQNLQIDGGVVRRLDLKRAVNGFHLARGLDRGWSKQPPF
jgi:hypothetical protein